MTEETAAAPTDELSAEQLKSFLLKMVHNHVSSCNNGVFFGGGTSF